MLDPGALEPRVEVVDVDELRAALVGGRGDGARQLLLAELAGDERRPGPAGRSRRERRALRGVSSGRPSAGDPIARARTSGGDLRSRNRAVPRRCGHQRRDAPRLRGRPARVRGTGTARQPDRGRRRPRARRLGHRARPRPARRAARTGDDRPEARRPCARCSASRSGPSACPDGPFAPKRRAPAARRAEAERGRGHRRRARRRRAARRCATRRSSSSSTRPGCAARRRSGSTSATSTSSRSSSTSGSARAARIASCRSARRPRPRRALPARGAPAARPRRRERALPLGARPPARHVDAAAARPPPAPPAPRLRDAPARGRRRPAHDPGAARPRLPLDDADVQPRRRQAPAQGLRPLASALVAPPLRTGDSALPAKRARMDRDPALDGFLALLAAQRAPRTVDAYRRDLTALAASLGKPVGDATLEELERYIAQLRADGLSSSTIARRTASARSFFRHQQLLGARSDNPAAAVALPRRTKPLPKTLSPGEAERLIQAAAGTPAALAARPRARRAALRRRAARLRGGRARPGRRRPRRPARARDRQGRQGAGRPDRPPRRRRAPPLPLARPPVPRPPPPARALPERPRRPADPRGRLPDPAQARREGRASTRTASTRTSCATRSPRTCWRAAPTSDPFKKCSGMPIYRQPSSTPT